MANIALTAIEARLRTDSVDKLVVEILEDDDPWLFRKELDAYRALKDHLHQRLELDDAQSIVVGSAKYGYSLAPDTFGTAFHSKSDIDVALISPKLFDEIWSSLLTWRYPWHTSKWAAAETKWALEHMEEHMAGFVDPTRITPMINGAKRIPTPVRARVNQWFDAFKLAENIGAARGYAVNGRLYRSLNHLRLYTTSGLNIIRSNLGA